MSSARIRDARRPMSPRNALSSCISGANADIPICLFHPGAIPREKPQGGGGFDVRKQRTDIASESIVCSRPLSSLCPPQARGLAGDRARSARSTPPLLQRRESDRARQQHSREVACAPCCCGEKGSAQHAHPRGSHEHMMLTRDAALFAALLLMSRRSRKYRQITNIEAGGYMSCLPFCCFRFEIADTVTILHPCRL